MKKLKVIKANKDFYIPHENGRELIYKGDLLAYKKLKVKK